MSFQLYGGPIAYKQPVRSNLQAQLTKTLQKHEDVHFVFDKNTRKNQKNNHTSKI